MVDWSTPQTLFDELNREFGFDLDVCAEPWNTKCPEYFTPDDNSLSRRWSGICWMNPPFGKEIGKWIRKAYLESLNGATVVCLLPAKTETEWFHKYAVKGEIRFIKGRIHFTDCNGKSGRPRFASMIVIFSSHKKAGADERPRTPGRNHIQGGRKAGE